MWQAGKLEADTPGRNRQSSAVPSDRFGLHLGTVRHLAYDVVKHVRRRGRAACPDDVAMQRFDDLDVEIGCGQEKQQKTGLKISPLGAAKTCAP